MSRGSRETFVPIWKDRVKSRLKEIGKTQLEMCEELGINYQNINRRLKEGMINKVHLIAIAQFLDVMPQWLSGEKEQPWDYRTYEVANSSVKLAFIDYLPSVGFEVWDDGESGTRLIHEGANIPITEKELKSIENEVTKFIEFQFMKLIKRKEQKK